MSGVRSVLGILIGASLAVSGLSIPESTRAAITSIPTNVAVVYLPGTKSTVIDDVSGQALQAEVKWLHRRMIKSLQINQNIAFGVNYYKSSNEGGYKAMSKVAGLEAPQILPAPDYMAGTSGCLNRQSVSAGSTLEHAYHFAWLLSAEVAKSSTRQFLVIGHSQGAALAKIVWTLSMKSKRDSLSNKLPNNLRPECWPSNVTRTKFYGHVYMGAPISGAKIDLTLYCDVRISPVWNEMCDIIDSRRAVWSILQSESAVPSRSLAFGGWKGERFEIAGLDPIIIPWQLTALNKVNKNFVVIPSAGGDLMSHAHWWNTSKSDSGYCPTWMVYPSARFCAYSDAQAAWNTNNPGARPIFIVDSPGWTVTKGSGLPGNIYDLIIMQMKLVWS